MIKKLYYAAIAVALITVATSCSEDEDDHLNDWMLANQQVFNAIKSNPEYKEYHSPGNEGSIWCKVLKKGEGTKPIYYTSTVSCYYKGWFVADYPYYNISNGQVFDQHLFDDGSPSAFSVGSGVINGWKTALQNMVEGDVWEVWIPYQLGYGSNYQTDSSTGAITIPAYSTLVFEIEVVKIY
ncbi:MAG: FKBP-type peptidyl-prolyl cis-trans isomerase [Tannerella sp.]|jgi:peptidylprolyl isomerase/FKBP-type peptidyl-prolyl cis-trans isomerase FklB|nr:FKBP-type peptidyl-prolyl cis-trans isomerase [Tannerella sp.]